MPLSVPKRGRANIVRKSLLALGFGSKVKQPASHPPALVHSHSTMLFVPSEAYATNSSEASSARTVPPQPFVSVTAVASTLFAFTQAVPSHTATTKSSFVVSKAPIPIRFDPGLFASIMYPMLGFVLTIEEWSRYCSALHDPEDPAVRAR